MARFVCTLTGQPCCWCKSGDCENREDTQKEDAP